MSVTIKDVAQQAGVSIATVSRVLNGERVKEIKRKLVEDVIDMLGYVPDIYARKLAEKGRGDPDSSRK